MKVMDGDLALRFNSSANEVASVTPLFRVACMSADPLAALLKRAPSQAI
jgi:hypothetical protein